VHRTVAAAVLIHVSRATKLLPNSNSAASEHKRYSEDESDPSSEMPQDWVVMLSDDGHSSSMKAAGGGKAFLVSAVATGDDDDSANGAHDVVLFLTLTSQIRTENCRI